MGRNPVGMRLALMGRRSVAVALSLYLYGTSILLAPALPTSRRAGPQTDNAPRIYHKARNFRIPFDLKPETKDRVKELHLLVSEDFGYHWRAISKTFPDHPAFTFRSSHDGEYWFAVQTRGLDGKVVPSLESTIEPNLKVVVDTFPPSLLLEPGERRGSLATVSWEAKDENIDAKSLVIEYQVAGSSAWRRVPLGTIKLKGSRRWDAGSAEALKVRASVADRANNVTEAFVDLPEGTGRQPDLSSAPSEFEGAPSLADGGGSGSDIMAGPGFTPVTQSPPSRAERPSAHRGKAAAQPRAARWDREPRDLLNRVGTATRLGTAARSSASGRFGRRTAPLRARLLPDCSARRPVPPRLRQTNPRIMKPAPADRGRHAAGRKPEIQASVRR